jgi:hypothetical protein
MEPVPIELAGQWLQNLLGSDLVNCLVAADATHVSLNSEDAELKKIMPWAAHRIADRRSSTTPARCSPAGRTRRST